jgi:hypothetical protein
MVDIADVQRLQHLLVRLERSWKDVLGQANRLPEEYGNAVANLRAPVNRIVAGEKYDLLCAGNPDISWERIHREKLIVLMELGTMSDSEASDSVSKAFVQSLLTYGGYLQDHGGGDIDLLFVGDEAKCWINRFYGDIVDKLRSCGVRTVALVQSEAGMRHGIKSADLYKHIVTNVKNRYTCATQSHEDQAAFVDAIRKVQIYTPQRTNTENPSLVNSANKQVSEFSTSESWTWKPEEQPLLDPEVLGGLPVGVIVRRVLATVEVFQSPYYKRAPVSYMAQVGMDAELNRGTLIEGLDYGVDATVDGHRLKSWGADDRLHAAMGSVERFDPDAGDLMGGHVVAQSHKDGYRPREVTAEFLMSGGKEHGDKSESADYPESHDDQVTLEAPDPAASSDEVPSAESSVDEPHADPEPSGALDLNAILNDLGMDAEQPVRYVQDLEDDGTRSHGQRDGRGLRFGYWARSTAAGVLVEKGPFVDGKKDGAWQLFGEDGSLSRTERWAHGRLVSTEEVSAPRASVEARVSEPAAAIGDTAVKSIGCRIVESVDDDGNHSRGLMRGSLQVGTWEIRNRDGRKIEVRHYDMHSGKPAGKWERYDADELLVETYDPQ